MITMQDELNQFERNKVQTLVERPNDHPIIGTKQVFRNKLDKMDVVIRNKVRLVVKDYNQKEDINFDEIYSPITRLAVIRLLLAFSCFIDFKLYQINIKNIFLNKFILEEVYVEQSLSFEDHSLPKHNFKLYKALYNLK